MIVHKKYLGSLKSRFGLNLGLPAKGNDPVFWIHGVSVGEIKAIVPLAKLLHQQYPQAKIIVSSITETGQAEAKRSLPFAHFTLFLPFDFSWISKRIIETTKPDLLILSESDFWYHFIHYAKEQGATIIVANAKLSERSCRRFKSIPWFSQRIFSNIDLICPQNHSYQERFEQIGIPSSKLITTGNLKFDAEYPTLTLEDLSLWQKKLGIKFGDFVLAIGSTHHPEEEWLLKILKKLWISYPHLKVLIAPRHPERFESVSQLLEKSDTSFSRMTQKKMENDSQCILIDTIGHLRTCYQLSDLAIVAGSYVSHVGGHNILEPSGYGVPVVFGPHMHSQPELLSLVLNANAGLQVPLEQLEKTLSDLLSNKQKRKEMGQAGLKLMAHNQGASKRTFEAIIEKLR